MTNLACMDAHCVSRITSYLLPCDIFALLTVSKSVKAALLGHGSSEDSAAELAHLLASSSPSWIPTFLIRASTGLPPGPALTRVTNSLYAVAARARGMTTPPPRSSPSPLETACLAGGLHGAALFLLGTESRLSYRMYVAEMKRCLKLVTRDFTDTHHLLVDEHARRSMRVAFGFPASNDDDTTPRFRVLVNALFAFHSSPDALLSVGIKEASDDRTASSQLDCLLYAIANPFRP